MKFNAIAKVLEKDPSTMSKEVVRSMAIKPLPHYKGNDCKFFNKGLFDVRNIDLPHRVMFKIRKQRSAKNPISYNYRSRRTYQDFQKYTEDLLIIKLLK